MPYDYRTPVQRARAGCGVGLLALAASYAVVVWIVWLAWKLIDEGRVGDLLILGAILIAWPAWHAVRRALLRDEDVVLGDRPR